VSRQYRLPYVLGGARSRVLVVGAGGGRTCRRPGGGAAQIDAVEIDPVVIAISHRFNADAPYDNPECGSMWTMPGLTFPRPPRL